jgi:hypothetical protein
MANGFPREIVYESQQFRPTGKTGINDKTGKVVAEYQALRADGARIWADAHGKIVTVGA